MPGAGASRVWAAERARRCSARARGRAGAPRRGGAGPLLPPATGRYLQAVFERPATGAVVLAHHLALAPNEAAWVLVPAMGGCTGSFPAGGEPERVPGAGRCLADG